MGRERQTVASQLMTLAADGMAMAGVFGLFCATYYWFPQLSGALTGKPRLLSEPLGKLHVYATLLGAYSTFLPMHLTGLAGEPRHYAQFTGIPGPAATLLQSTLPLQRHITVSAIFLACAQLPFFINVVLTLRARTAAPANPWQATTLEWSPTTAPTTYRSPCHYSNDGATFLPQWEPDATSPPPPE